MSSLPPDDVSAYLSLFLDEAGDQIALMEGAILSLEQGASQDALNDVFRAAHTLKGSSRAMGYQAIGDLTHAMEDAFSLLRSDQLAISTELIEALLIALDLLKSACDEIARSSACEIDTSEAADRLRTLLGAQPADAPAAPAAATAPVGDFRHDAPGVAVRMAVHEAFQSGLQVHEVTIHIARDCAMRSVRAMLVLQAMERIGSVLFTTPSDVAIENEEFDFVFGLLLATDQVPEAVVNAGLGVSEVERVETAPAVDLHADEASSESNANATGDPPVAAPTAAPELPAPGTERSHGGGQTVRVDVARLDNLLNLVGELVIDQTRLAQIEAQMRGSAQLYEQVDQLREATAHLCRITTEMQEEIMKARMLPLDNLFARFPRMVRDLAHKLNRDIAFTVSGRETELDRSVIEVMGDPLIHLLRNCIDHGIEPPEERLLQGKPRTGSIHLSARHEESHIVIEIQDDGRGIDPDRIRAKAVSNGLVQAEAASRMSDKEALNLIFAPGFSTAETVTEVSGRGVGMDIVRNSLTRFGAILEVDSRVGQGTRFVIRLPLTLAIIRGLLVTSGGAIFAIPLASIVEAMQLDRSRVHRVSRSEMILSRGSTLPLVRLDKELQTPNPEEEARFALKQAGGNTDHIVVVSAGNERIGIVVDSLLGEQEIVIKSLSKHIGEAKGLSGATILGDGRIALIVDVNGLLAIATERKVKTYAA